jgi:hypothetical protein
MTCRFGPYCRNRDAPSDDTGGALCWPCERHAIQAVRELPDHYEALGDEQGQLVGRGLSSMPGSRSVEAAIPINLGADAMAREIRWTLEMWAVPVAAAAGLADVAERGVRGHVAVARAGRILLEHFPTLRSLPPAGVLRYGEAEPVDMDGADAAVQLADLCRRVRRYRGVTEAREPREGPCPLVPCRIHGDLRCQKWRCSSRTTGCGERGLHWLVGTETITCDNCGHSLTLEEYGQYTLELLARQVGRRR